MKHRSIRSSFLLIVCISLALFLVSGIVAARIIRVNIEKRLTAEYGHRQAETARQVGVTLQAEVQSTQDKLGYLAQIERIQSPDGATCNTALKEILATFGASLGNLGRIGADGKFYCSVNSQLIGVQGRTLGKYVSDILEDPQHKPVMSRMIKPAGSDSYLLAVHVPVTNRNGVFLGTLGGAISVNRLAENYLSKVRIGESGFVSISDDNGDIIYARSTDLIGKNRYGSEVQQRVASNPAFNQAFEEARTGKSSEVRYSVDGEERFAVLSSVEVMPGRRWIITGVIPVREISQSTENLGIVQALRRLMLIALVILIISITIMLVFLRRRVFKPVLELDAITNQVQEGNMNVRVKYHGDDEFGRLGHSFNMMLNRLRNYNVRLQDEVNLKTSQVEKVLEQTQEQNQLLENTKLAVLNILDDLNEEKANVESEKAKDEAILTSIGDGVFAIDTEHRIILFNKAAEKLTGFKANDVIGKPYDESLQFRMEKTGEELREFIHTALSGTTSKMPGGTLIIHKDGHEIPVEDSAAPIRDSNDNIIGAIIVFRDVTEERALDQAKEEFVSIASHELRTPATAVKNFIGLLREGYAGELTKEQKEYVEMAYESNERELEIITSLLYVARSDAGRIVLSKQPVNIQDMIDSIITEQEESIKQRKQTLAKEYEKKPISLELDQDYMRMALTNIVSNASKYTKPGGKVTIKISINENVVQINITDTGVGIAPKDKEKLFKKFSRIDNELSKVVGGNGLGLYLTKQIIDLHGGNIDVQSKPGKGTTFTVTLPMEGKDGKSSRR